jgi:hypothetical protein
MIAVGPPQAAARLVAALLFPILQAAGQSIVAEPTETVQARSCARKEGMVVQAYTRAAPGASTAPRSTAARRAFQRKKPARQRLVSPIGACPGYVVDHVEPLACGGIDAPENMQWQSVAEAKAKDRRERNDCAGQHTIRYSHFPRNLLRHYRFMGLREDMEPREIVTQCGVGRPDCLKHAKQRT